MFKIFVIYFIHSFYFFYFIIIIIIFFAFLCVKRSNFYLESIKPKISLKNRKIKLQIQSKEYMIAEKAKRREKVREFTVRETRSQKIMFPATTEEYNIYKRCNKCNCFPIFFFFFWKITYRK